MLRLFLLRHGRPFLAAANQTKAVMNTINIAKKIISEEVRKHFLETTNVRLIRKNGTNLKHRSSVPVPENIKCPSDLHALFEPLEQYINNRIKNTDCLSVPVSVDNHTDLFADEDSTYNTFFEVGTRIRVRWNKDEVGDSGWHPGWYVAEV